MKNVMEKNMLLKLLNLEEEIKQLERTVFLRLLKYIPWVRDLLPKVPVFEIPLVV